jgi:hypothetical protein
MVEVQRAVMVAGPGFIKGGAAHNPQAGQYASPPMAEPLEGRYRVEMAGGATAAMTEMAAAAADGLAVVPMAESLALAEVALAS